LLGLFLLPFQVGGPAFVANPEQDTTERVAVVRDGEAIRIGDAAVRSAKEFLVGRR
jgi:hypothetical protein